MKSFLVIGMGRFGTSLAKELFRLGNEVVAVDEDAERMEEMADYVTQSMCVNLQSQQGLTSIGARNFDHVIIAFSDNIEDSILLTLSLKDIGVSDLTVKARDELHSKVLKKIGADHVVFPEKDMGVRLAQGMTSKNLLEYIDISSEYNIAELRVPKAWVGRSIKQVNVRAKYGLNILLVKSNGHVKAQPEPEHVFSEGELLIVLGSDKSLERIDRL